MRGKTYPPPNPVQPCCLCPPHPTPSSNPSPFPASSLTGGGESFFFYWKNSHYKNKRRQNLEQAAVLRPYRKLGDSTEVRSLLWGGLQPY